MFFYAYIASIASKLYNVIQGDVLTELIFTAQMQQLGYM